MLNRFVFSRGIVAATVLSPLLMAACAGDAENATVSKDEFVHELPKIVCDNGARCSCDGVPSTCVDDLTSLYGETVAQQDGPDVTYDGECAAKILDVYRALGTCEAETELPKVCCKPFNGKLVEGDRCSDGVCGPGLECDNDGYCSYICYSDVPRVGHGEACGQKPCEDGLVCSEQGVCVDQRQVGETCEDAGCIDGAYCSAGVCERRLEEGEACDAGLCGKDLTCSDGVCFARRKGGEACTADGECDSSSCLNGVCEAKEADACYFFPL